MTSTADTVAEGIHRRAKSGGVGIDPRRPAHLVTAGADLFGIRLVAGGTAQDVATGAAGVAPRRTGVEPPWLVGASRGHAAADAALPVTAVTEIDAVTAGAGALNDAGLRAVAGEEVAPVDEVPSHPRWIEHLRRQAWGGGVTIRTVRRIVALGAELMVHSCRCAVSADKAWPMPHQSQGRDTVTV